MNGFKKADALFLGNIIAMDGKDTVYEALTSKTGLCSMSEARTKQKSFAMRTRR